MRRVAGAVLVLASACSAPPKPLPNTQPPPGPRVPVAVVDAPSAPAAVAPAAPPAEEPPLAWGTRPSKTGPLYPVVDGMCIHAEAWPLDGATILTWGNATDGGFSRGDRTTFARFVDDGLDHDTTELLRSADPKLRFGWMPTKIEGRWPHPIVAYSGAVDGNRLGQPMGDIWLRDEQGWKRIASTEDRKDAPPFYLWPAYFQGHVIVPERIRTTTFDTPVTYRAVPPLAGIATLNHFESAPTSLVATDDALYVIASAQQQTFLREWKDGKARNVGVVSGSRIALTKPNVVVTGSTKLFVLVDGKLVTVAPPLPAKAIVTGVSASRNGDLWIAESSSTRVVVARKDRGYTTFDELPIPAPAIARPIDEPAHVALVGGPIAGAEHGDPYVIGKVGALFHFEGDAWKEITLPQPPWSTNRYRAQSLAMAAQGDLFVNAGYGEKGPGWTTPERYRAILRTKRPKEVLRCNEPASMTGYESGSGFMSFPPYADDTCATPFVVILRTTFGVDEKTPLVVVDPKSDFPGVREAIKATPSLGASTDLVLFRNGHQRYLGAAVPSLAAGRELVAAVAKRVKVLPELRPEIVCGAPPNVERTIAVSRPQ